MHIIGQSAAKPIYRHKGHAWSALGEPILRTVGFWRGNLHTLPQRLPKSGKSFLDRTRNPPLQGLEEIVLKAAGSWANSSEKTLSAAILCRRMSSALCLLVEPLAKNYPAAVVSILEVRATHYNLFGVPV